MPEPRVTSDRDDVEAWADEHDAVPVREGDRVRLVRETDLTDDHERLDWETFHREVDEEDRAVTYYGDAEDREPFEVSRRDDALDRVVSGAEDVDREEAERRLVEGETVTGTVTETTVVEETIVEEATIESEVVDREVVGRDVVDVELADRECQACDVTAEEADFDYARTYGTDRFLADDVETVAVDEYPFDVTVEVREDWVVTIEERERYTVETDITDVDVSETEEIEARDVDADIDVDAVHRQLLGGDLVDFDVDAETEGEEVVDTETYDIESEVTDEDVLTTYLTSRRLLEREISERSRLTADVIEGELLDREVVREEAVDSGLVERDADSDVETDTEVRETGVETDTGVTDGEVVTDADDVRVLPDDSDEGKTVVDADGDEMGEVIDVSDGVAYVDPHPSLAERVMSRLGFDEDEEYYELRSDNIDRITVDEIVVATDEFDDDVAR
ncbi:hypothetical protein [Halorussus sp. AFM4]|uniref:hypothetical protein n=1 Tax=Halorussus sp. AFM4 TaxID=3421651 RepID=UPI003EB8E5F9